MNLFLFVVLEITFMENKVLKSTLLNEFLAVLKTEGPLVHGKANKQ